MPSTLALIRNMFHDAKQRGTAIGDLDRRAHRRHRARPGAQRHPAGALLVGLGLPDQHPGDAAAARCSPRSCCPSSATRRPGGSTCSAPRCRWPRVLPVIYGIKEMAARRRQPGAGCSPSSPACWWARSSCTGSGPGAYPMVDLALFRRRGFAGSLAVNLLAMFALVGFAIFTTQYLQLVLGLSPLRAALWSLVPSLARRAAVAPARRRAGPAGVDRAYLIGAGFVDRRARLRGADPGHAGRRRCGCCSSAPVSTRVAW